MGPVCCAAWDSVTRGSWVPSRHRHKELARVLKELGATWAEIMVFVLLSVQK